MRAPEDRRTGPDGRPGWSVAGAGAPSVAVVARAVVAAGRRGGDGRLVLVARGARGAPLHDDPLAAPVGDVLRADEGHVAPASAVQGVDLAVRRAGEEHVAPRAGEQDVGAEAGVEGVVAPTPEDPVVAAATAQHV